MKTSIHLTAVVLALFLGKCSIVAQSDSQKSYKGYANKSSLSSPLLPSMDLYGAIPHQFPGWGFGLNVLSSPYTVAHLGLTHPIQVRIGGEFYWEQLYHKNIGEVPLSAPQTGNAKVRLSDDVYGINALTRFALPWSAKLTPYVDLFAGLRGFSAAMNITPETYQRNYQRSTSQNLSSIAQFNYGVTGGIMTWLGKSVKLNLGLMYSYSPNQNEIVNVNSAKLDGGSLVSDKMLTPKGMFSAKIGLTFLIDKSNSSGCHSRCSGTRYRTGGFFRGCGGGFSNHVNFNIRS